MDDITSLALHRAPFSFDAPQIPQGSGSGFVWEAPGHVVTSSRSRIDRSGEAKVVGAAPDKDVAAIRIKAPREKLIALAAGNSRGLAVGRRGSPSAIR